MDVRDVLFWASEAQRHRLGRRTEAYNAALLPWQKPGTIQSMMSELEMRAMEAEFGEEAEEVERENAGLIARAKERKDDAIRRRREGGPAPPKRKPRNEIRRI